VDLTPLYGLKLRTDRLELRWPTENEVVELAQLAERGVHDPRTMPFSMPWTDGIGTPGFVEEFVGYHMGVRDRWRPDDWSLDLGVWAADQPIGTQTLVAHGLSATGTVSTGSWLALHYQSRGYGTEMRAAILELAFHGLGALVAVSHVLDGVFASARVSEKLGYVEVGEKPVEVRGEPRTDRELRLTRDHWIDFERTSVRISGLERCLPLFGLDAPPTPWGPSC
jgi:RimJ/RimL family protein N-acetyltransferase